MSSRYGRDITVRRADGLACGLGSGSDDGVGAGSLRVEGKNTRPKQRYDTPFQSRAKPIFAPAVWQRGHAVSQFRETNRGNK